MRFAGGVRRWTPVVAIGLAVVTTAAFSGARAPAAVVADADHTSAPAAVATRPAMAQLVAAGAPLAFWPLTGRLASVAADAAGGHDGVVHGTLRASQIGPGPGEASAGFNGSTSWISASSVGLAPGAEAASAWFRVAGGGAGRGTILDTAGIALSLRVGHVVASTCAVARSCTQWRAAPVVTDGAWHQVAVSVSGGVVRVYLDGSVAVIRRGAEPTAVPPDRRVTIGKGFRGNIDNVAVYAAPLTAADVNEQFVAGACPQAAGSQPADTSFVRSLPALPLHTRGRFVVDAHGGRVKLAGVNWFGAEELDHVPAGLQCQSVDAIAAHIAAEGSNVVRLAWATDTWTAPHPSVPPIAVAANPGLRGRGARGVFDATVHALARHGLLVILDNHVSRADWCCTNSDGNALWWEGYDPANPPRWKQMSRAKKMAYFSRGQARWLRAWTSMATRYGAYGVDPQPAVVGADLRNEPRDDARLGIPASWGASRVPVWSDWPRAASLAGRAVLRADPALLVAVEGTRYATNLRGVAVRPVHLGRAHRLIYSAHDYAFTEGSPISASELRSRIGARWGWLLTQGKWYTTPVWVGEFGTCHPEAAGCGQDADYWFAAFRDYLQAGDIDWTYWSVNGTGARGAQEPSTCMATPRFPGCSEGYGLSDDTWAGNASASLSAALHGIQPAAQGP